MIKELEPYITRALDGGQTFYFYSIYAAFGVCLDAT